MGYNRLGALVIGLLQIIIGVTVIVIQTVMLAEDLIPGYGGVGFWTGIFFIITGGLQVGSWHMSNKCMIVATMVMCIITSLVCALGVVMAFIVLLLGRLNQGQPSKYKLEEDLTWPQVALIFCDGILAIVGASLCCAAVCCRRSNTQHATMVHLSPDGKVQSQQEVVIVTSRT